MNITNKKFLIDFGMAQAILHLHSKTLLTFTIIEKEGKPMNESETVAIELTELRPDLYMATWTEKKREYGYADTRPRERCGVQ